MKNNNYNKFKTIARTTAVIVVSTMVLSGCASNKNEKEKEEDLYVMSHGSYIPYHLFMSQNGVVDSNTKFYTKSGNGYTTYKPSSSEILSIKSGSFSGKVSRPVISKGSTSSSKTSSIKSFGGNSSRISIGG